MLAITIWAAVACFGLAMYLWGHSNGRLDQIARDDASYDQYDPLAPLTGPVTYAPEHFSIARSQLNGAPTENHYNNGSGA